MLDRFWPNLNHNHCKICFCFFVRVLSRALKLFSSGCICVQHHTLKMTGSMSVCHASQCLCRGGHVNIIQHMLSVCPLCVGRMIILTSYKTWCQCFLSNCVRMITLTYTRHDVRVSSLSLCVGMITLTSYKTWCQCVLSFSVSGWSR